MRGPVLLLGALAALAGFAAQADEGPTPGATGPYNLSFLQGGVGMVRTLPPAEPLLARAAPWTLTAWIRPDLAGAGVTTVAVLGAPDAPGRLQILLEAGRPMVRLGATQISAADPLAPGAWRALAVRHAAGRLSLWVDGRQVAEGPADYPGEAPRLALAPTSADPARHFGGALADFRLRSDALTEAQIRALAAARADVDRVTLTPVGVGWPLQVTAWTGLQTPQDPWTLPQGRAPVAAPVARPVPVRPALLPLPAGGYDVGGWRMTFASRVSADGAAISRPGFVADDWYAATVPGTVLTTLIDRGVYPDPDHGLDNLAIPESLSRQSYWYRTEFEAPQAAPGARRWLTFKGVNYAAEVFVNGRRAGEMRGAFVQGRFDVTDLLRPGVNAVAVRVSPPPHPGIPSEESIAYGPGGNGGALALDGPTFIATEGWDWIPGIRDRNTGLWQGVELTTTGVVRLGVPYVVTHLPLPLRDRAELDVMAPVDNSTGAVRHVTLRAAFEGVSVETTADIPPGRSEIALTAKDFPQLRLTHPRLWWPNGYGAPELYHLEVRVDDGGAESDRARTRFGVREISYDLSLFDHDGRLKRVEVDPAAARGVALVDGRHEAIKEVANGWAQSLTLAGEGSTAVRAADDASLAPYLVIKVNGVRIAARGGSWGMDDSRKRVSRDRLAPYFRLHREAGVNIIRNWLGQNTEDVFYDLADENGLLVLNDFWESTQNFQLELQDPALFLTNAEDVIRRYRGHPSVAVWFGRNEGVPQPIVNEGLADLVNRLDGTRLYTGSSNRVNLQDSGPYDYRPPEGYFTSLAGGFSVEVGTPSLATLEAIKAMVPAEDRWPISDTLAYHDWHFGGNGDVAGFMATLTRQFGAPDSLEDFERKAQMMNLVDYRAIFEGFLAHLWTRNSGRLLWMTHPAWPSNHWQMYSADYDTQASYYGVKSALEPVHAQLNLPDFSLTVGNTTLQDRSGLTLESRILPLDGRELSRRRDRVDAPANQIVTLPRLDLARWFAQAPVVLVALRLTDSRGREVSRNLYWQGADSADLTAMDRMPQTRVDLAARASREGGERVIRAVLRNPSRVPALAAKLTLVDDRGARILPAYYSDNYVSLLPGETRVVTVHVPGGSGGRMTLQLRGWNLFPATQVVSEAP